MQTPRATSQRPAEWSAQALLEAMAPIDPGDSARVRSFRDRLAIPDDEAGCHEVLAWCLQHELAGPFIFLTEEHDFVSLKLNRGLGMVAQHLPNLPTVRGLQLVGMDISAAALDALAQQLRRDDNGLLRLHLTRCTADPAAMEAFASSAADWHQLEVLSVDAMPRGAWVRALGGALRSRTSGVDPSLCWLGLHIGDLTREDIEALTSSLRTNRRCTTLLLSVSRFDAIEPLLRSLNPERLASQGPILLRDLVLQCHDLLVAERQTLCTLLASAMATCGNLRSLGLMGFCWSTAQVDELLGAMRRSPTGPSIRFDKEQQLDTGQRSCIAARTAGVVDQDCAHAKAGLEAAARLLTLEGLPQEISNHIADFVVGTGSRVELRDAAVMSKLNRSGCAAATQARAERLGKESLNLLEHDDDDVRRMPFPFPLWDTFPRFTSHATAWLRTEDQQGVVDALRRHPNARLLVSVVLRCMTTRSQEATSMVGAFLGEVPQNREAYNAMVSAYETLFALVQSRLDDFLRVPDGGLEPELIRETTGHLACLRDRFESALPPWPPASELQARQDRLRVQGGLEAFGRRIDLLEAMVAAVLGDLPTGTRAEADALT